MKLILSLILGVLSFVVQAKGPAGDLVTKLPEMDFANYTGSANATSGFEVYSGYMPIGTSTKRLHFLLAESQGDWATDPLIIWFNGGPGCSSLLAFATENGPYQMSAGESTFHKNEHAWNQKANVLYVEQPAGVGFSYCNGTSNPEDCKFTDMTQSNDTLAFVEAWMQKYPDYQNHSLYISGESYGGIYIPYLAWQLAHNSNVTVSGFMVGNGVTNWKYDTTPATIQTAYAHAMYSDQLHDKLVASGCDWSLANFNHTEECGALADEMFASWQPYFNFYNMEQFASGISVVNYSSQAEEDECVNAIDRPELRAPYRKHSYDFTPWAKAFRPAKQVCVGGDALGAYYNSAAVRSALHIPDEITQIWAGCGSAEPEWDYTMLKQASQWIWEDLQANFKDIRMLKFSGDQDGAVPTTGSVDWINTLGWATKQAWAPWMDVVTTEDGKQVEGIPTQVGGYIWRLDGMDFVTVQDAGHMVPEDQPARAYKVIFDWINQTGIWAPPTPPAPPSEAQEEVSNFIQ